MLSHPRGNGKKWLCLKGGLGGYLSLFYRLARLSGEISRLFALSGQEADFWAWPACHGRAKTGLAWAGMMLTVILRFEIRRPSRPFGPAHP